MRHAPELFLGAYIPALNGRTLVGVVCATVASSEHLTLKSMDEHIPSGTTVCIHTVCVSPTHRKKGIALSLLQEYIARLKRACRSGALYERVVLITHEHLIPNNSRHDNYYENHYPNCLPGSLLRGLHRR